MYTSSESAEGEHKVNGLPRNCCDMVGKPLRYCNSVDGSSQVRAGSTSPVMGKMNDAASVDEGNDTRVVVTTHSVNVV